MHKHAQGEPPQHAPQTHTHTHLHCKCRAFSGPGSVVCSPGGAARCQPLHKRQGNLILRTTCATNAAASADATRQPPHTPCPANYNGSSRRVRASASSLLPLFGRLGIDVGRDRQHSAVGPDDRVLRHPPTHNPPNTAVRKNAIPVRSATRARAHTQSSTRGGASSNRVALHLLDLVLQRQPFCRGLRSQHARSQSRKSIPSLLETALA
eukprot:3382334-Rhodomonas_salina.2